MDDSIQLIERRVKGLENHLKRLGSDKKGYLKTCDGEIFFDEEFYDDNELNIVNQHLYQFFDQDVFKSNFSKISEFGFNTDGISQFISKTPERQLYTVKMMQNLWHNAASLGIIIMNGTEVVGYTETSLGY